VAKRSIYPWEIDDKVIQNERFSPCGGVVSIRRSKYDFVQEKKHVDNQKSSIPRPNAKSQLGNQKNQQKKKNHKTTAIVLSSKNLGKGLLGSIVA